MKSKLFVLDANTLVSAFLLEHSIVRSAYDKARQLGLLVSSDETFNEFCEVFIRPKFDKYLSFETRNKIIEEFPAVLSFIQITEPVTACRDPKDDKYLSLAVSAKADCIITGDKDLLVLNPFQDIAIVNSGDFLKLF